MADKKENKRSPALAAHYARIAGGRSVGALRKAMADAGIAIGQGTLGGLAKGISGNTDTLRKLAQFAGMDADELLRPPASPADGFVEVARVDVKFSNGHGVVIYHEDERPPLSFRSDFLSKLGVSEEHAVVVDAVGHSNEPKILDGAVVLVDRGDRDRLNGEFFAFRADGELLIKRLERVEGVGILATAENSDFRPKAKVYREGIDDFEVIGRARWMGAIL